MPVSHSSKPSQYLCFIALRSHAEISCLDLFHQGDGHVPCATIHSRPFQFDPGHGTDCCRDIGKALLGIRFPRHHVTDLGLVDQIVSNHALLPHSRETFHQFTQHRDGVGRHAIQPMSGIITPHQAVDDPINAPHRHIDAD